VIAEPVWFDEQAFDWVEATIGRLNDGLDLATEMQIVTKSFSTTSRGCGPLSLRLPNSMVDLIRRPCKTPFIVVDQQLKRQSAYPSS
jgi:hypothetical protein